MQFRILGQELRLGRLEAPFGGFRPGGPYGSRSAQKMYIFIFEILLVKTDFFDIFVLSN